jgi:membrane-associated phospholipid phosphatase
MNVKNLYNRARPLQLAKFFGIEMDTIITNTINTASYPSGHTVYASMIANIIQKLYPEIPKYQTTNLVDQTGLARILQGVHFPSDNQASIKFSNTLVSYLYSKLI